MFCFSFRVWRGCGPRSQGQEESRFPQTGIYFPPGPFFSFVMFHDYLIFNVCVFLSLLGPSVSLLSVLVLSFSGFRFLRACALLFVRARFIRFLLLVFGFLSRVLREGGPGERSVLGFGA